jgi:hypothetical protein
VHRVSVFGDVEVLLHNAPHIREERPVGTDTGAILIGVGDVVSSYRDQSAITNF